MNKMTDDWDKDFLEYCEIMKLAPTIRDQMIFMAGMTFQSINRIDAQAKTMEELFNLMLDRGTNIKVIKLAVKKGFGQARALRMEIFYQGFLAAGGVIKE